MTDSPDRRDALERSGILDLLDQEFTEEFDRLARLAADSVQAPESSIVAVGADHARWLGVFGRPFQAGERTTRDATMGRLVVETGAPVVLPDFMAVPELCIPAPAAHLRAYLGVPLRDRRGRILGAVGVGDTRPRAWTERDVLTLTELAGASAIVMALAAELSDRRRADARLQTAAREFMSLAEHTPDVIARFDRAHRHVYVNAAIERAAGLPRDAWLGKTHADLGHPADVVARWREALTAIFATGEPGELHFEYPTPDGPRWYECRLWAEFTDEGTVGSVLNMGRDVSEQRRAAAALAEREGYYRALIENVGEVVTVADAGGIVRYISPAVERLMQLPASTYLGRHVLDGVHPDDVAPLRMLMIDLLVQPGGSRPADYRRRNAAGEWRVFSAVATNLLDDPAVRGIVINSRDVTARRQLEQQLRQAQKMEAIGQLAGGVAHDFNNLLTVIGGTSDLLQVSLDELAGTPVAGEERRRLLHGMRDDVAEIRRTADRAAALTAQLLAVSRQQVVQPEVLDLDTVVRGVEGLLRRVLHEGIVLSCLTTCEQRWVTVDRGQAEQIFLNLAVNARDAMPNGGALAVETGCLTLASPRRSATGPMPPGHYVVLSVRDTGTGMDEATRARIFEPFFTTKLEGKGTGLGLATVLSIVEQSGGYLTVTSAPGGGTTFDIFLPAGAPPTATVTPRVAPAAREHAEVTETVLIVEDEQAVRTMLRRILQAEGYRVLEARHGADALLIAEEDGASIDLVLTDMVMPEMGGAELLAALHQLRPTLPTIVMSGYAPELSATADDGFEAVPPPPSPFLAKPFTTDGVLRLVREVLDRRVAGKAAEGAVERVMS